jgi:hypothetical protein
MSKFNGQNGPSGAAAPTTVTVYHADDICGRSKLQIRSDRSITIKSNNRFFRYDNGSPSRPDSLEVEPWSKRRIDLTRKV